MSHDALLGWFDTHARPFLESNAPERIATLVSDADRLRRLKNDPGEFVVCFLGNAGVGKSTLLNALVAGEHTLLPAGGIGPLTAMATTVRFADTRSFTVHYHAPKLLWQVAATLMLAHETVRRKAAGSMVEVDNLPNGEDLPDLIADGESDLAAADVAELAGSAEATVAESEPDEANGEAPVGARVEGRLESIVKQAKQLVTGDQYSQADLPYLVDSLRIALGREAKYGHSPNEADAENIARLRTAIRHASADSAYHRDGKASGFVEDLRRHAAGHLAPLIKEIEVGWPADILRDGLVLVDLPGIGVANDAYRSVTQEYVRDRARAVVVVVNRAGITEAVLDLIRTSGYWDRLVGAADDPESDPCALLVAVSGVDDVADEEWRKYQELPKEERPTKREEFAWQSELMVSRCRAQAAEQLSRINRVTDNEAVTEARGTAAAQILDNLEIHPVSAPEYRRVLADDEDDRPRMLREKAESGIPRMAASLASLALGASEAKKTIRQAVHDRLARGVGDELTIVETLWRAEDRAAGEAEKLRQDLEVMLGPVRQQLANRQGSFREFLQETVKSRINELVLEARDVAEQDVRAYLRSLRNCHWMTLRAAVQRGGTFYGAYHIDLPGDISDYFQEPMAGVWGVKLLRDVRKRTKEYADDCVHHVDEVCDWARTQGARVKTELVDSQQKSVRNQASQLHQVGKEASDELRAAVRTELHRAVAPAIRKKCEEFVQRRDNVGRGVKVRILELFDGLALDATRAAEAPAKKILQRRYSEVREQIDTAFLEWGDPLQGTVDAIASSHEQRLRRSDAQKRSRILSEIAAVRKEMPDEAFGNAVMAPDFLLAVEVPAESEAVNAR